MYVDVICCVSFVIYANRGINHYNGLHAVLWKGVLKDDGASLSAAGVKNKAKIMVVGTTMADVLSSTSAGGAAPPPDEAIETAGGPLCEETRHAKILSKGPPDDVHPAILGVQEPLPDIPLTGLLDMSGKKVRMTLKPIESQVWIGSAEHTRKFFFNQIHSVTFAPITNSPDHPGYEILTLQLGSNENSKMFLYWVRVR